MAQISHNAAQEKAHRFIKESISRLKSKNATPADFAAVRAAGQALDCVEQRIVRDLLKERFPHLREQRR